MLVYSADKDRFFADVSPNRIEDRVVAALQQTGIGRVSPSEVQAFRSSLLHMKNVLEPAAIPHDAGVAIEYRIPQTAKRIDFIISGTDVNNRATCVIVELKQWQEAEPTNKDGIVVTYLNGGRREVTHPSYQAWSYAALLEDFNEAVQTDDIALEPCAYLHNYEGDALIDERYGTHTVAAPVFRRDDVQDLQRFIANHVQRGDQGKTLYRLDQGRIRPSKELADELAYLLRGNRAFVMIDDQKIAYEGALEAEALGQRSGKQVLIVEGGPGTGKSVIAINLLVELIQRDRVAQYVTRNQTPRQVFQARLTGTMKKTRIDNLFKGSGSYTGTSPDTFDTLIVDEAHRLIEKSRFAGKDGEPQIKEIIRAARTSIFFIDESQRVTWNDVGSIDEIQRFAEAEGATIQRANLASQFRCNGSDGYLAWLDQVLQLRETAQDDLTRIDYELAVVDSPSELRERIQRHNRTGRKARLVAGYCWDWVSRHQPDAYDIELPESGFAMQWNLNDDQGLWLEKEHSIDQVGCIHTVQGLELDVVGVIIGPDLIVRDGEVVTDPSARARTDKSLHGYKKARTQDTDWADAWADEIIKNTYKTLMSRGLKGCIIYCTDPETRDYFRHQVSHAMASPFCDEAHETSGRV
jgi:DUF2075 family protein